MICSITSPTAEGDTVGYYSKEISGILYRLFGQRTAADIAAAKSKIMEEWGISKSKVMCLTTDGAANMGLCTAVTSCRYATATV